MYSAHKESNIIIVELVILAMAAALFLRTLIIASLVLIPQEYLIMALSTIILISLIVIVIEHLSKYPIFPIYVYLLAIYLLLLFCIVLEPLYLPLWIRIIAVLICMSCSLRVIQGMWTQNRWYYIFQFELIGKIKMQSFITLVVILFDIIDSASSSPFYLFFIVSLVIIGIVSIGLDSRKMSDKLFCYLYLGALVLICIYHYLIWGGLLNYLSCIFMIPVCFYCYKHMYKRRTVLLLAIITAYNELYVYLKFLNMLPDAMNSYMSFVGLGLNFIAVLGMFIKVNQKHLRDLLSHYVGTYTSQHIIEQIESYMKHTENAGGFFGRPLIKSVEYAGDGIFNKEVFESIKEKIELSDSIFETKTVRRLPIVIDWLRDVFWFIKRHRRIVAAIPLILIIILVGYSGIHTSLTDYLGEHGILSTFVETSYYAHQYSLETLQMISRGEDIGNNPRFPQFMAWIMKNRAEEYEITNRKEMQIKALSLSLNFEYDYDTLKNRFEAYSSTHNYADAMRDLNSLLLFNEADGERESLIDTKSVFSLNYGHYKEALESAHVLSSEYSSRENDAWVGACLIGNGRVSEAIQILNTFIEESESIPIWVIRMRGIAFLTLVENGEDDLLLDAIIDIEIAYEREKSLNNILAYARLCLYLGDNAKALELIEYAIEVEGDSGRAYYWLSECYSKSDDNLKAEAAMQKARDLNYVGNGEY